MSNIIELAKWSASNPTTHEDFEVIQPISVPVVSPPLGVLPDLLKQFVEATAESLNCPVDYVFMPLIAVAGGGIGRNRVALPKPDWAEYAVVWLGVVGDPSTGKTPAFNAVSEPLKKIQRKNYQLYEQQLEKYEDRIALWHKDKSKSEKPQEPQLRLVLVTDATLEALRDLLTAHPKGITLLQGELRGWLLSMNQYKGSGRGSDRQVWLELWSSEMSTTARKSGSVFIPDPFVNVMGGLQPDVLEQLTTEGRDGFIARVLLIYPDRHKLHYDPDSSVPKRLQDEWQRVFDWLWDLQPDGHNRPVQMPFTAGAKEMYAHWLNNYHLPEIDRGDLPMTLVDAWSKLRGYAVRISLILQCIRMAYGEANDGEIDEISVSKAIEVLEYCKTHLKRAYNEISRNPNEEWISAILSFLRSAPLQSTTVRDVQRARVLPKSMNKASQIGRLFHEISDLGYAKMECTTRGSLRLFTPLEEGDKG